MNFFWHRDLSGSNLAKTLVKQWGYTEVHQRGSPIILDTDTPSHQRIVVPNHKILKIGTLNSVLRAVAEHKGTTREAILETLQNYHLNLTPKLVDCSAWARTTPASSLNPFQSCKTPRLRPHNPTRLHNLDE